MRERSCWWYISEPTPASLPRTALEAEGGGEHATLRSRAGKTAALEVWPEAGMAYSADGDTVHFVELFPPRSLAAYEQEIYQDPGPFVR